MIPQDFDPRLAPFVMDAMLLTDEADQVHELPFYADGVPGMVYLKSLQQASRLPDHKPLASFFLYGQTIKPIALQIEGPYRMYALRLYPFSMRLLLGVDPKVLNDECYDLREVEGVSTADYLRQMAEMEEPSAIIHQMGNYLIELVRMAAAKPDHQIKMAVSLILKSEGQISMREVRDQLFLTERTFERHFAREIGLTPKQFARIIQFSFSLNHLSQENYHSLTELSYQQGFADQSHFTRTFKHFTGQTPKEFQKSLAE